MRTRIHRWGNSLAVRIPKAFAQEARLQEDTPVEINVPGGRLLLMAVLDPDPTLDQLLAGVTEHNRHGELDTGPAVGNEVW